MIAKEDICNQELFERSRTSVTQRNALIKTTHKQYAQCRHPYLERPKLHSWRESAIHRSQ